MYTVIGTLTSRAFRVLWALEELGQPFAHEPVPPHSERVMALNRKNALFAGHAKTGPSSPR